MLLDVGNEGISFVHCHAVQGEGHGHHENHPYPPSREEISWILVFEMAETEPPTSFNGKVLDGAAVVHLLPTTNITSRKAQHNDQDLACLFALGLGCYGSVLITDLW
jgi:hypothetical protein